MAEFVGHTLTEEHVDQLKALCEAFNVTLNPGELSSVKIIETVDEDGEPVCAIQLDEDSSLSKRLLAAQNSENPNELQNVAHKLQQTILDSHDPNLFDMSPSGAVKIRTECPYSEVLKEVSDLAGATMDLNDKDNPTVQQKKLMIKANKTRNMADSTTIPPPDLSGLEEKTAIYIAHNHVKQMKQQKGKGGKTETKQFVLLSIETPMERNKKSTFLANRTVWAHYLHDNVLNGTITQNGSQAMMEHFDRCFGIEVVEEPLQHVSKQVHKLQLDLNLISKKAYQTMNDVEAAGEDSQAKQTKKKSKTVVTTKPISPRQGPKITITETDYTHAWESIFHSAGQLVSACDMDLEPHVSVVDVSTDVEVVLNTKHELAKQNIPTFVVQNGGIVPYCVVEEKPEFGHKFTNITRNQYYDNVITNLHKKTLLDGLCKLASQFQTFLDTVNENIDQLEQFTTYITSLQIEFKMHVMDMTNSYKLENFSAHVLNLVLQSLPRYHIRTLTAIVDAVSSVAPLKSELRKFLVWLHLLLELPAEVLHKPISTDPKTEEVRELWNCVYKALYGSMRNRLVSTYHRLVIHPTQGVDMLSYKRGLENLSQLLYEHRARVVAFTSMELFEEVLDDTELAQFKHLLTTTFERILDLQSKQSYHFLESISLAQQGIIPCEYEMRAIMDTCVHHYERYTFTYLHPLNANSMMNVSSQMLYAFKGACENAEMAPHIVGVEHGILVAMLHSFEAIHFGFKHKHFRFPRGNDDHLVFICFNLLISHLNSIAGLIENCLKPQKPNLFRQIAIAFLAGEEDDPLLFMLCNAIDEHCKGNETYKKMMRGCVSEEPHTE